MNAASREFLNRLLLTPRPSGYEEKAQAVVREYVADFADEVTTDLHGNVHATLNPGGSPRILFAGHVDQIGFIVQHIDDKGLIYFSAIGGHDVSVLLGANVVVWTRNGGVPGVISRQAIHVLTADQRGKVPQMSDLWIDIGAKDKAEVTEDAGIRVGDPVTFKLGITQLRNDNIASPGLDNAIGVWSVMEALRYLSNERIDACVVAVSTVQEEIGVRGAATSTFTADPQVGIAVDVNHATDIPGMNVKEIGDVKLGGGPIVVRGSNINPRVFERIESAAERADIPIQVVAYAGPTPTDARAIQISRGGVATGLVKVPNRYMHSTVEVINLNDLENTAKLLAEFVIGVEKDADFTPR
ncbi:MAG: M42 family metallopeptidase [Candidatus Poribacteria bacterium]|nr:M42 family metallopeptidase [Candidatus Poribacteria bacterium]